MSVSSQKVVFAYDAAGNRISRSIVLMRRNAPKAQNTEEAVEPFIEKLGANQELRIYPNPTRGIVFLDITGAGDASYRIQLFNLKGIELRSCEAKAEQTAIDMTSYPEGVYILRIHRGDEIRDYKIIKK